VSIEDKPAPNRRDFLYLATGATGTAGAVFAAWPFVDQMNPTAGVLASSTLEADLAAIKPGTQAVFKWRGHPLVVRRRTPAEIAAARATPLSALIDRFARNASLPEDAPATDANRTIKPEWLVLIGVCTHLGCSPAAEEHGGWLCRCHGSVFDTSGRVRTGPAAQNLFVPRYAFVSPTKIRVG